MDSIITAELIEAYSQCHRKAFLLLRGDPQGEQHEYDIAIAERAIAARSKYLATVDANERRSDSRRCRDLLVGDLRSECDALLLSKIDKTSSQYEPHLVVGTASITREYRLRLAFAGYAIGEMQRNRPTYGIVIPFNEKLQRVRLVPLYPVIESIIGVLREWSRHLPADPPPLILSRHCQMCLFHQLCVKEAEQQDNLSLLERMTPKVMQKYRKRGIFTINQLSYVYRPRRRRKRPAIAPPVFNVELQALAIRTSKIYLHEPPSIPTRPVELFLDIEGLPDENFDYLIGLDVREGNQVSQYSFWADSADEEVGIFENCLGIVAHYPDAPIFHYGSYEPRAFARIAKKHGIKCDWFTKLLVNINTAIFGKVYFPVRSNRLKDVGAFIGAKWSIPDVSGLHSIAWRWCWEHKREEKYKELLLAYNRDDCHALRLLSAELQSIGQAAASRSDVDFADAPKQNATPLGEEVHHAFEKIINSAHAEYRRNRIQVRPSHVDAKRGRSLKPSHRIGWATRKNTLPLKVGKTIRVPRKRTCPRHPARPLIPIETVAKRAMIDLAFTKTGCRKTIIRYMGKKAECPVCNVEYNPPAIRQLQGRLFGHGFESWAIYQHIALRLPYSAISQLSADMFSEELNVPTMLNFLTRFAVNYAPTEQSLLGRILQSPFVHADETKINIKGINQYVWVLTNGNHVVFRRTETRESTLIKTVLDGYEGVLISDFYGGYDAVACRQQKCLVHLIRDLNDDLWKNTFNQEYELFVDAIRDLLVPIFTDIDRYGLKTRHLHKHRKAVDRFYATYIERGKVECELIAKYQKRFSRYSESIFRFLDVDGLPWNNNTAEQAIRHLAIQRKISCSFSARGADEYLPLLGISQTCRFQEKSFLRFLLSGEKDVDAYVEHRRRKNNKKQKVGKEK